MGTSVYCTNKFYADVFLDIPEVGHDDRFAELERELRDLKPPIPRDRLIFEAVVVQRRGQLEVAAEHGISQPRVSIIVAEVTAWLCRVLPEATAKEATEGQLALGFWLAEARLEFLYGKALQAFDASGQDKVVLKQGTRQNVTWEERTTTKQSPKAGLLNGALRAVTAAARMCTAAAKSSGNVRRTPQESSPANPVMSKTAKMDEQLQVQSPQTETAAAFATGAGMSNPPSEAAIKKVMEVMRRSPERVGWSDAELRYAAERRLAILDAGSREYEEEQRRKAAAKKAKAAARAAHESASPAVPPAPIVADFGTAAYVVQPIPRQHEQDSISLSAARMEKLRREREKRRSPQERRREFLAPLAAG